MTEVEKRRLRLLQQTRKSYRERNSPPAVHPRYHMAYQSIYGNEDEVVSGTKNSFVARLIIAMIIFVLFYMMDHEQMKIGTVNSQSIIQEVQRNLIGK